MSSKPVYVRPTIETVDTASLMELVGPAQAQVSGGPAFPGASPRTVTRPGSGKKYQDFGA